MGYIRNVCLSIHTAEMDKNTGVKGEQMFTDGGHMNKIYYNDLQYAWKLTSKTKCISVEDGIHLYGGATVMDDQIDCHFMDDNNPNNDYIPIVDSYTIGIYVPTTFDVTQQGSHILIMTTLYNVKNLILERYRQVTKIKNCKGFWKSATGETVSENIQLVELVLEEIGTEDIRFFCEVCRMIKDDMKQESVCFTVNTHMIGV